MGDRSNTKPLAFKLKGTMPALTMLCVLTHDIDAIEEQLVEHISQMPQFFLHAPVMFDLELIDHESVDLASIATMLRKHKLVPVAVRNPTKAQQELAVAAGLGVLQTSLVRPGRAASESQARQQQPQRAQSRVESAGHAARSARHSSDSKAPPPAEVPIPGLTVRETVRSGQVVYAPDGDLVVLAPVNSGAELIAEGNIHVYAPFRGRALAGVNANTDASVFCMGFEAEFVSIAGHHLQSDDIPLDQRGKPARVHIDGDRVVVTSL